MYVPKGDRVSLAKLLMKTIYLTITGHAQNGKDTVAEMLSEELKHKGHSVCIIHYADILKFVCKQYLYWDGNKDEKGRTLLQKVGTDIVRKKAPNLWVDFVGQLLMCLDGTWDFVIIPDTRFPNEIDRLKTFGINPITVRVTRENFVSPLTKEQQNHPSETALDNTPMDVTITNSGTLEDLKEDVMQLTKLLSPEPNEALNLDVV